MGSPVCFIYRGDIRYDTRLQNMVASYVDNGSTVTVVQGGDQDRTYDFHGARVISFRSNERGPFGFLKFWVRASQLVSRVPADVLWASDLFSLPVAAWRSLRVGARVGYDSRELFAHLGALKSSPIKQRFWYGLERTLIARVDGIITSGELDSDYLEERYNIARPAVIRNLPRYAPVMRTNRLRDELGISNDTPICLYQGLLAEGRGVGIMLELATRLREAAFVFIGGGVMEREVVRAAEHLPNVYHVPKVARVELPSYTASATLGFALIEPITLSYLLALPNKLFEYVMAGIPVIASFAPQMEEIVSAYKVGRTVPFDCMGDVVEVVGALLSDTEARHSCALACVDAARELCWERESDRFNQFVHAHGLS